MSAYPWLLWLHILAASTWAGGMILVSFLLPALVRGGASQDLVRAGVRVYARVSWGAMVILAITGLWQMHALDLALDHRPLAVKIALVLALAIATAVHQALARRSSTLARRMMELGVLLLTLTVLRVALEI